jgi:hypothetical protein
MILVIATQDQENYGYRWKFKGGSEYKITGVPVGMDLEQVVNMVRKDIECDNEHFRTNIVGYYLEANDWLSDFEKSQLEYEGKITYKEPTLDYGSLVDKLPA